MPRTRAPMTERGDPLEEELGAAIASLAESAPQIDDDGAGDPAIRRRREPSRARRDNARQAHPPAPAQPSAPPPADVIRSSVNVVASPAANVLFTFEEVARLFPNSTMTVSLRRMTGTPAQWMIDSRPKTANELYAAIKQRHGRNDGATYEVSFYDSNNSERTRGTGTVSMPSTLDELPLPGQPAPMNPYPGWQYGQQPPQPQQHSPEMTGMPPVQPPPGTMFVPGFGFVAVERLVQALNPVAAPQAVVQPLAPVAEPIQAAPQSPQGMPPVQPPPGTMFVPGFGFVPVDRLVQALNPTAAAPQAAVQQQPQMAMMPPVQPPAGMYYVPGFGFIPVERLFQALIGAPAPNPGGPSYSRPSYPGDRQGYGDLNPAYRGGTQGYGSLGYSPPGYQPPQKQKTAAEEFRDAVSIIRVAADVVQEMQGFSGVQQQTIASERDDDSPITVIDAGPAKLVINKKDGSARYWETGWANLDKVLKWTGEQREAIQKANNDREAVRQQRPQLPPGYVEMTPGYQPPPGYVAVPIDPRSVPQMRPAMRPATEQTRAALLPEPPAQMPLPLMVAQPMGNEEQVERTTWGMPIIPGG